MCFAGRAWYCEAPRPSAASRRTRTEARVATFILVITLCYAYYLPLLLFTLTNCHLVLFTAGAQREGGGRR